MLYFVTHIYAPDTATTNRYMGFLRSLTQLDIDHVNVSFFPTRAFDRIDDSTCGLTKYLWPSKLFCCHFLNLLQYVLWAKILCKSGFLQANFFHSLKKEDVVVITNPQDLSFAIKNNRVGYRIYHERTEHPEVSRSWATDKEQKQYLKDCCKVDGLFVISTTLRQTFINYGVEANRIHIINMTVDPFRFEGLIKQRCERYIAYCGTASNTKDGVDDLIRSFSIVANNVKDLKLYIIGKTPDPNEINSNLELIKRLGIEDRIVFTGLVKADQMPQLLKNATALVLARPNNMQAQNGFPTKLGEYLLSENPVIITKTGDIPLFLKDGFSALLCEPGNCEEIANKIIWVINNHEDAMVIGKQGKEIALAHFNCKIEAEKILKVIRDDE